MKLLLHTCCGPCLEYPHKTLKSEKIDHVSFFYNPNIHPFWEYTRRKEALVTLSEIKSIPMVFHSPSDEELKREVTFYENEWTNQDANIRCEKCYSCRMDAAAQYAAENGFDSFSTTLLLSIYQNHDLIKKTAMEAAEKYGVKFYYRDFREGFKESQTLAKQDEIYRQKHCGCIVSLNTSALKNKIYANSPEKNIIIG